LLIAQSHLRDYNVDVITCFFYKLNAASLIHHQ